VSKSIQNTERSNQLSENVRGYVKGMGGGDGG